MKIEPLTLPAARWQPRKPDLLLAAALGLLLPPILGWLYGLSGALLPMLLYYGLAWGVVQWRRGSSGYFNPFPKRITPFFYLNLGVIVCSLIFAYLSRNTFPGSAVSGILLTALVWAPLNAASEQLLWIYLFEAWDLYPQKTLPYIPSRGAGAVHRFRRAGAHPFLGEIPGHRGPKRRLWLALHPAHQRLRLPAPAGVAPLQPDAVHLHPAFPAQPGAPLLDALLDPALPLQMTAAEGGLMEFTFIAMNAEYANMIVAEWCYEHEYAVYDYVHEADHMLDADGWGRGIFAVLDPSGALAGELSIEFIDQQDEYLDYLNFGDVDLINRHEMWVGFGLRPDLVGRGHGFAFVSACVDYAVRTTNYRGEYVRLGVAVFNRARSQDLSKSRFPGVRTCPGRNRRQDLRMYVYAKKEPRRRCLVSRAEILHICDQEVLETAAARFGTRKDALKIFPEYEGAANLVYEYEIDKKPLILRISFTPERTSAQIHAELHYVNYLYENGVSVSRPIRSQNGNFVETIQAAGIPFHIVTFVKGKGMRVPDNGYRYRADAPIEEYFQNWGRMLGKMHALSKNYDRENDENRRPQWFDLHKSRLEITDHLPERLNRVQAKIYALLDELKTLPRDKGAFGLIHGDFNDGNFTVDYANGELTVFDFDDACYFWFIYEIASAWEGGIGRVMFRGLNERKSFMLHYMEQVMEGYHCENALPTGWLERLPLFVKLIQVEEFLHYAQYVDEPDAELQSELNYKIKCIADDIPFMGFFDNIYSPEKPFSL